MNIPAVKSRQPIPDHAKLVFKGKVFDVYQWEQELYDGRKVIFEKLKRPDTVVILPVLDDGTILLVKEEQPGIDSHIGTLGGRVDEGKDILSAAKRELLEESGYEAREFILFHADHPVTKIDWAVYTFIAKGLKKVSEPDLDGGEKIELQPVSLDTLMNMVLDGTFREKEIAMQLLEAKIDPEKYEALKDLFKPL